MRLPRSCWPDAVSAAGLLWALLLLTGTASAVPHLTVDVNLAQSDPRAVFTEWTQHFKRNYEHNEFEQRLDNWYNNLQQFVKTQTATAQLNGLADMTDEEFRQAYLGQHARSKEMLRSAQHQLYRYRFVQPLAEVDWRKQGVVGPVKNQHVNGSKCGCCWAFATIGVVESINAMATGEMVSLSEQQLLDCDHAGPYHDEGCNGGDFDGGMTYIIENGIDTEADYPYKAEDGSCDRRKERRIVVTIDAIEDVPPRNETALMQGVSMHPIGVAVCVGPYIKEWRAYTGGILHLPSNCDDPLDHAMVVVGYGEDEGTKEPFWLLKNGWGAEWGEDGFLRIPRGLNGTGSIGLLTQPGYPLKISPNPRLDKVGEGRAASWDDWVDILGHRAALAERRRV